MPQVLPNTTTTDSYPSPNAAGASLGLKDIFASGFFVVANAAVFGQYYHGVQGQQDESPEIYMPPGTYPLVGTDKDPIAGIRFRSAVIGSPAQVFGVLFKKDEASLLSSAEFSATVSPSGGISGGGSTPTVGDYKISAKPASHADPSGTGTWYLCDGSVIPAAETQLIALVGGSVIDQRGRALVMKGTHADVDTIGDVENPAVALASRRPKHNTTITDPTHTHTTQTNRFGGAGSTITSFAGVNLASTDLGTTNSGLNAAATGITANAAGGGATPTDQPAFGVPGNLFVYGSGS